MNEVPEFEVVRWFTRARKFPQLIGRTPDGAKIPGGPYTVTQAVGAGLILVVGLNTMSLWARFGLLGNLLVLATITWLAVWSLGRIPVGSRTPLSVTSGLVRAVAAPAAGRIGGRPVRIRRPRVLRHQVVIGLTPTSRFIAVDDTAHTECTPSDVIQAACEARPAPLAGISSTELLPAAADTRKGDGETTRKPRGEAQASRPFVLSGVQALLAASATVAPASTTPLPTTSNSTESPR